MRKTGPFSSPETKEHSFPSFTQENAFSRDLFGEGGKNSELAKIEQALSKIISLSPRRDLSRGTQLSFSRALWVVS